MQLNLLVLFIVFALTGALTFWFSHSPPPAIQTVPVPVSQAPVDAQAAPDFSFVTREGKEHALNDFRGKTVVLNFWASWCAPCLAEFPKLLETAEIHKKEMILIALTGERSMDAPEKFLQSLDKTSQKRLKQSNVHIAQDPGMKITQDLFQTFRLPETIIIGPDGTLRKKLVGANWEIQEITSTIQN